MSFNYHVINGNEQKDDITNGFKTKIKICNIKKKVFLLMDLIGSF